MRYRARAIVQHAKTRDTVAFRSWDQAFVDAQCAIDLLRESLNDPRGRRLVSIFGEVVGIRSADIGGIRVQDVEVQAPSRRQSRLETRDRMTLTC